MSLIRKPYHKRISVICLCLACLFMMGFPLTAHAAVDAVDVTLRVDQTFAKNSTASSISGEFFYELLPVEAENPMPSGSIGNVYPFKIDKTASKYIGPITFTKTGVYHYQIKGVFSSTARSGYTYDKQVYSVTVYVRHSAQQNLVADIMIQKTSGVKTEGIKFNHAYTPLASKSKLMVSPSVQKKVSGSPSKAGTFTFSLSTKNPENPMPIGSVNRVKTISIVGQGEKSFGTWKYVEEGTYYYTISEQNTGETGYTYDTTVYTIIDVVEDVNGQLVVTRSVTNGSNKQVQACTFINKYSKSSTNGPKTGDDSAYELYMAAIGASLIVAVGCIIYLMFARKRRKESESEQCAIERTAGSK